MCDFWPKMDKNIWPWTKIFGQKAILLVQKYVPKCKMAKKFGLLPIF